MHQCYHDKAFPTLLQEESEYADKTPSQSNLSKQTIK